MEPQSGCLEDAVLAQYLKRELTDSERIGVEKHAARCPDCRTRLVERFEFNRERVISSLTPEGVLQRALTLCGSGRASPAPGEIEPAPAPPEGSRSGLLLGLLLLLILAVLAYAYFQGLLPI